MRTTSERMIEKGEEACTSRKKREEREGRSVRIASERIIEKGEEACASHQRGDEIEGGRRAHQIR